MTDANDLLVRREDGVLVLTFNRPQHRNALTQEMQLRLGDELAAAELDGEVGCVLLTGAGGAFCAGGDVKNMARGHAAGQPTDQLRRMEAQRQSQRRTSLRLFEMGKPTLAALPGAAAGAGLSMALACDMRIAAETAIMSTAFVKIGLSGDYGGTYLLTRLVGPAKARELYLLGDRLDMTRGVASWPGELGRAGRPTRIQGAGDRPAARLGPAAGPSVHQGQPQPRAERHVRRVPRHRERQPDAAARHRGPQGSRARLRRETRAEVHRALIQKASRELDPIARHRARSRPAPAPAPPSPRPRLCRPRQQHQRIAPAAPRPSSA